jgi:hypothetical protein
MPLFDDLINYELCFPGAVTGSTEIDCPHCGADFGSASQVANSIVQSFGIACIIYFGFFYDTTNGSMHNIGLLNNRLCGMIFGVALVTWGVITSRR